VKAVVREGVAQGSYRGGAYYNYDMVRIQGKTIEVSTIKNSEYDYITIPNGTDERSWSWLREWLVINSAGEVREARVRLLKAFDDVDVNTPVVLDIYTALRLGVGKDQMVGFSVEREGRIAYASKPEHLYDITKRQRSSLQRYIRRQLKFGTSRIKDHELDLLCRQVVKVCYDGQFTLLKGVAIADAYERHAGCDSCMTGDRTLVEMYAINSNIELALYQFNGREARALLWTCDDGMKVLDRIYPNDGGHIEIMKAWAAENGWIYRVSNSLPEDDTIELSDRSLRYITVKPTQNIPYLDTFYHGEGVNGGMMVLSNDEDHGHFVGDGEGGYTCEFCGAYVNPDDCFCDNDDYICDSCQDEYYVLCDRCDEYVNIESSRATVEVDNEIICRDCRSELDIVECYHCGSFTLDYVEVDNKYNYCECCADIYADECDKCGNLTTNIKVTNDDSSICPDCWDEKAYICDGCGSLFDVDNTEGGYCVECQSTRKETI